MGGSGTFIEETTQSFNNFKQSTSFSRQMASATTSTVHQASSQQRKLSNSWEWMLLRTLIQESAHLTQSHEEGDLPHLSRLWLREHIMFLQILKSDWRTRHQPSEILWASHRWEGVSSRSHLLRGLNRIQVTLSSEPTKAECSLGVEKNASRQ